MKPCFPSARLSIIYTSHRLASNIKAADKSLQSLEQFTGALEEFLSWMQGTEHSFDRLMQETGKADVIGNEELCSLYLGEFRVREINLVAWVVFLFV
ncbi:hypothetical protein DPMN_045886 [Dreissena polymorpha]|uniref:Dystrophin n=1 Tax=Dreissena polymorpha TaxID=45954 RepID=A0A9D4I0C4_DREPO|nr:hypothetical protein DPMN_045886 [Dreissena polymorpha]